MVSPALVLYRRLRHARRATRRLIVLGAFGGYPATLIGYSTLVATGTIPTALWAPFALAFMSLTIFGTFAIYGYARDRAQFSAELDERQRHVRDQAWIVSYVALSTAITLVAGITALWLLLVGPISLGLGELAPWFIALGVFLPLLPSAALAWIEPDELDEGAEA